MRLLPLFLMMTLGCRYASETGGVDADQDGFGELVDCDDASAATHPGLTEVPYNGLDDDCDPTTADDDLDGDGALEADDCDDADPAVHPDATETCNGVDDDCSGVADDSLTGAWYVDADGDGFGDGQASASTCTPGDGRVDVAGDCDDDDEATHPGATEDCGAVDRDCDGFTDRNVPGETVYYLDADQDLFGDAGTWITACTPQLGYVAEAGDCDDGLDLVNPDVDELCNGRDDDCDLAVDEDPTDAGSWFLDHDGDGYGDPTRETVACDQPGDHVASSDDCDDLDDQVHPGATEICDGKVNDCEGQADVGAVDGLPWYPDADGDTWGADTPVLACEAPEAHVAVTGDCLDIGDVGAAVHPGAVEVCDEIDNDCDGTVDNAVDPLNADVFFRDLDTDGYGDPGDPTWACSAPGGYVDNFQDCDDSNGGGGDVHPGATEVCNGADDDCDGTVDDVAQDDNATTGATRYYLDGDGDGWGVLSQTLDACSLPTGHAEQADDCDDADPTTHPQAAEVCTPLDWGGDHDCDDVVDGDDDLDGYPGGADCTFPTAADAPDCDDAPTTGGAIWRGSDPSCPAGASCLDALTTWGLQGSDGDYWLDPGGTPSEFLCDMTDDGAAPATSPLPAALPGAGWTLIYAHDFSGSTATARRDGWKYASDASNLGAAVDGLVDDDCDVDAGEYILGEYAGAAGDDVVFRDVDTSGVPHDAAYTGLTFVFVDEWETDNWGLFYVDGELVWEDNFSSTAQGFTDVCGDDAFVDRRVALERMGPRDDDDTTLRLRVDAIMNSSDEGFGVDDVSVWVR